MAVRNVTRRKNEHRTSRFIRDPCTGHDHYRKPTIYLSLSIFHLTARKREKHFAVTSRFGGASLREDIDDNTLNPA